MPPQMEKPLGMRLPPADVVDSWPMPNYGNPVTQGPALLITNATLMPLACLVVAARIYARAFLMKKAWIDDWLMAVAMVFVIGTSVTIILMTEVYGWKIHIWDLKLRHIVAGRKASLAAQMLYLIASGLAKISILASYLRITARNSLLRTLTVISMMLIVALTVTFFVMLWTQCIPTSDYWNITSSGKCIDESPPLIAQAVTNVVTDFLIYALPLPTFFTLKLRKRQKAGLLVVFSLSTFVVLAGSFRTHQVIKILHGTYDVTWNGFEMWIWTAVEVNLGVICGCIPMMQPLFKYFGEGVRRTSKSTLETTRARFETTRVRVETAVPRQEKAVTTQAAPWFGNLRWELGSDWLGSLASSLGRGTRVDEESGAGPSAPRVSRMEDSGRPLGRVASETGSKYEMEAKATIIEGGLD